MTPTRSQLRAWAADAAAGEIRTSLTGQADVMEVSSGQVRTGAQRLASGWSGRAYDAATSRVDTVHQGAIRTADNIDSVGSVSCDGLTELHHAAVALLSSADSAEADECIVSDTWVVTAANPEADDSATNVAGWQAVIQAGCLKLDAADRGGAAKIQTVLAPLAILAGLSAAEMALLALIVVVGVAWAILWMQEHFPEINIEEILTRHDIDTSDGGSGSWVPENITGRSEATKDFEEQVTGHPPGITYEIPSDHAKSGKIHVDGVEPAEDGKREKWIDAKYNRPDYAYNKDGTLKQDAPPAVEMRESIDKHYRTARQHDAEVEWVVSDKRQLRDVQEYIDRQGYGDRFKVRMEEPRPK